MVFIDGEHSYGQCLKDLENSWRLLEPEGIILLHDTFCEQWPGVARALSEFQHRPGVQSFTINAAPGISLVQKEKSLISIRRSTRKDNVLINEWREAAGIATRPLPGEAFPEPGDDPRVGLFSILENDMVIGGFGIKRCVFTQEGPDNFRPDNGEELQGFLQIGSVLRPDKRSRGIGAWTTAEVLRWFSEEGIFLITARSPRHHPVQWTCELVGKTQCHAAYRLMLKENNHVQHDISSLSAGGGHCENCGGLETQIENLLTRIDRILSSNSWKATAPLRFLARTTKSILRRKP